MANGDVIDTRERYRHLKLLDAITASGDGVWIDTYGYEKASIEVDGIVTATIEIDGSNAAVKPDDTAHGKSMVSVTADGMVSIPTLPRWIKARTTAYTDGTISVFAKLINPGGLSR